MPCPCPPTRAIALQLKESDVEVVWDSIEVTHEHGDINFEEFETIMTEVRSLAGCAVLGFCAQVQG